MRTRSLQFTSHAREGKVPMPRGKKVRHKLVKSEVLRYLLIGTGWISIAGGLVGLFLPLVPTVPFLLLRILDHDDLYKSPR